MGLKDLFGTHIADIFDHYETDIEDFKNLHYYELDLIEDLSGNKLPMLLIAKLRKVWTNL